MSKNAASKRRAKASHRVQFAPWAGADLCDLITNIQPQDTPFMALIRKKARLDG